MKLLKPSNSFILFISFLFFGCQPERTSTQQDHKTKLEQLDGVSLILIKDDSLGSIRNHACKTQSLSETIKEYVQAVQDLNFGACPKNFTTAFDNHLDAWRAMLSVTDQFPHLRGEMHDLFDQMEESEHGDQFKPLLKDIWDSWGAVEDAKNELTPFTLAYEVSENDLVPEGLAYNPADQSFYIGSTWKRKILKIDSSGSVQEFISSGQDGMLGVIGLKVDSQRQTLWVCTSSAGQGMPVQGLTELEYNKSGIFNFDLKTGELIHSYWLEEPNQSFFFNDLTLDQDGRVFATEMRTRSIFTIDPNKDSLELFFSLPQEYAANGIDINEEGNALFLALYGDPNTFAKIDIRTKEFTTISLPNNEAVGADGLYFVNNSLLAVQPFNKNRTIAQYHLNEVNDQVDKINVLMTQSSVLDQPTTGAIKGGDFYFIGNSQLQKFARIWKENKGEVNYDLLDPIKIVKVKIEK